HAARLGSDRVLSWKAVMGLRALNSGRIGDAKATIIDCSVKARSGTIERRPEKYLRRRAPFGRGLMVARFETLFRAITHRCRHSYATPPTRRGGIPWRLCGMEEPVGMPSRYEKLKAMAEGCRKLAASVGPDARLQLLALAPQFERLAQQHRSWEGLAAYSAGTQAARKIGDAG